MFLIFLLSGCGEGKTADDLIARAHRALEERQFDTALIELKNALQKDPTNAEARFLLGKSHLELGDAAAARVATEKAITLGLRKESAYVQLARAELLGGDPMKAKFTLEEHAPPSPSEQFHVAAGDIAAVLGQVDSAHDAYEAALSSNARSVGALVGKARLAMMQNAADDAQHLVSMALEIAPDDVEALVTKGQMAFRAGDFGSSKDAFAKASKLAKHNLIARLGSVQALIASGDLAEARSASERLMQEWPQHPNVRYFDAYLKSEAGDLTGALDACRELLANFPSHTFGRLLLATLSYKAGNLAQAMDAVESFLAVHPDHAAALKLKATLQILRGNSSGSVETLTQLPAETVSTDPSLQALLSTALGAQGEHEEAATRMRVAAALLPDEPDLALRAALAEFAAHGDLGKTTEALSNLVEQFPSYLPAQRALADLHLRGREWDEALRTIERALSMAPDDAVLLHMASAAHFAKREEEAGRETLARALRVSPDYLPALRDSVSLKLREGDLSGAKSALLSLLEKNPTDASASVALARLESMTGNVETAVKRLEGTIKLDTDYFPALLELARILALEGQFSQAREYLSKAISLKPDASEPRLLLADIDLATGRTKAALETLTEIISRESSTPALLVRRAHVYELMGDMSNSRADYEKALNHDPSLVSALRGLVRIAISERNFALADSLITDCGTNIYEQKTCLELEGDIALAKREYKRAIRLFDAVAKENDNEGIQLKLFAARLAADQEQLAVSSLESWAESNQLSFDGLLRLASFFHSRKNTDKALKYYQLALALNDGHPLLLNDLAWLVAENGDLEEAVALARRAHNNARGNPSITDTLGWLLLQQGNFEQAARLLEDARKRQAGNPNIRYHYAVALARNGDTDGALSELNVALETRDFEERAEAEKLKRELER
ncbi:MAG: PEP-CTERM system TPR-repeat protein PrsT [Gammaproteobacteria bacterium]